MRVTFFLLAATAATLLANGSAASNAEKATVSTMVSPDQTHALDAAMSDGNEKRLRSHKTEDDDDLAEERINSAKVADLASGFTTNQFSKWLGKGYSVETIRGKLLKTKLKDDKRSDVLRWYGNFLQGGA
ncbi:hypothetical protein PHYPSEUDO_015562 [Phytophthora pseudosyringae]|uniref:RxLR effector protein n=1 Tax=Phytophthora pseudosyringae TaxID=221518 RepID=A0A8T1VYI9_9STRA|nr:hypothetical protein PHYPSEUDO_015562 [Phytophthora pseudosyringae]